MRVKFVTSIYSKLFGTEFGGRSSREFHYKASLLSLLKMTDADFVVYTSEEEYDNYYDFFYENNNISKSQLIIKKFSLYDTKYFEQIKSKKDLNKMLTLDRCYEVQYNKFYWLEKELDDNYDYYYWIDAGLSHSGIIPPEYRIMSNTAEKYYKSKLFNNGYLKKLIEFTEDKIYLMGKDNSGRNFWSNTVPQKYYETFDRSIHTIGGLFGGPKNKIKNFINLFDEYLKKLLDNENELYFEELVMALIYQNHKENFKLHFFETWWYDGNGPYPKGDEFYQKNKPFYKLLTELQMKNKFFVISLPRSGTTSISKMAKMCGLSPQHAPLWSLDNNINGKDFDFFSDTPTFCPSYVEKACQNETINAKFIFVDRDFELIFKSWNKVSLFRNYDSWFSMEPNTMNAGQKFDFKSYLETFDDNKLTPENYKELFENHKNKVLEIVKKYNKEILIYNFSDGWEPFCDFIGCEIPNEQLPHLNRTNMFDKL